MQSAKLSSTEYRFIKLRKRKLSRMERYKTIEGNSNLSSMEIYKQTEKSDRAWNVAKHKWEQFQVIVHGNFEEKNAKSYSAWNVTKQIKAIPSYRACNFAKRIRKVIVHGT